jgi:hypothetical protein
MAIEKKGYPGLERLLKQTRRFLGTEVASALHCKNLDVCTKLRTIWTQIFRSG